MGKVYLLERLSYGHCGAILSDASDNEYLTEGDEQPEKSRPEHGAHGQIPHAIGEERNLKEPQQIHRDNVD